MKLEARLIGSIELALLEALDRISDN